MRRRSFLKAVGGATGGLALGVNSLLNHDATAAEAVPATGTPCRLLGRTGQKVSVVGFPGLSLIHCDQQQGTEGIHSAFDRGINYFDNAPAYGKGEAETKMGIGLVGLDRSRYFLACKTKMRDKAGAREELERSLKLLKTDHFDLYQLHHLRRIDEVKQALGPGGAIETLLKAKEEGKVRFLGFSAHTTKAALEAMKGFRFDTAMFPISFVEYLRFGFGKEVLETAHQQGIGVLAIKAMSRGGWPKGMERTRKWWYRSMEEPDDVDLAIRFSLSQPGVAAIIPPSFLDLLDKAIVAAKGLRPIVPAEVERLRTMAQTCESIFQKEDAQASWHGAPPDSLSDNPYDGCCGHWA